MNWNKNKRYVWKNIYRRVSDTNKTYSKLIIYHIKNEARKIENIDSSRHNYILSMYDHERERSDAPLFRKILILTETWNIFIFT